MADLEDVLQGLTSEERAAILGAELADSHEWWLHEPVSDHRIAGSDLVLTKFGLEVRARLLSAERGDSYLSSSGSASPDAPKRPGFQDA